MSRNNKFKVGDKVVRRNGARGSYAWGEFLKECSAPYYTITTICGQWVGLEGWVHGNNPRPFHVENFELYSDPANQDSWDYAEADRLEQAATDAIKAYNEYVQRQPKKVYLPMYLPD